MRDSSITATGFCSAAVPQQQGGKRSAADQAGHSAKERRRGSAGGNPGFAAMLNAADRRPPNVRSHGQEDVPAIGRGVQDCSASRAAAHDFGKQRCWEPAVQGISVSRQNEWILERTSYRLQRGKAPLSHNSGYCSPYCSMELDEERNIHAWGEETNQDMEDDRSQQLHSPSRSSQLPSRVLGERPPSRLPLPKWAPHAQATKGI